MIRVETITIVEFRGIRNMTLDFKGKNFAICGPNGTGKSGIVDALEFVLTGNISRLSGEGSGDISVKKHAPHVDKINDPGKSFVRVTLTIPHLDRSVTIERSPLNPTLKNVSPGEPEILKVLEIIAEHPEIKLSRREIIRYVLATPGKRADEVQALLHLEKVSQVRAGLQKIANTCEKDLSTCVTISKNSGEALMRALNSSDFTREQILAAANAQRTILGLAPIAELTATTSLKDGMATSTTPSSPVIPKSQAITDLQATRESLNIIKNISNNEIIAKIVEELTALNRDPLFTTNIKRDSLYKTSIDLIEVDACPLCDKSWDIVELKAHIQTKILHLEKISEKRKLAVKSIAPMLDNLQKAQSNLGKISRYAELIKPSLEIKELKIYSSVCEKAVEDLHAFLPLSTTIEALQNLHIISEKVFEEIVVIGKAFAALPEPSKQDAAIEQLTLMQARLEDWREAKRKQRIAEEQARVARKASNIYSSTCDRVLASIYTEVQADFASLYAFIHRDDEGNFKAKLEPSLGKLGFDVDFYGYGYFPPGAYHSEGHQDGMGLCLYLALMRHLQGDDFTFAVLDDVLMSIDSGHRREVCALLKREFPNTQFIMTTHDPIWLQHMQTEGLVSGKSKVKFRSWSVDNGPDRWDELDIWGEITGYLSKNEVQNAAAFLRRYLEYISTELCHKLRAPVQFRADAQYELGELLPSAINRMRGLYKKAKTAANSWHNRELLLEIEAAETTFSQVADASNSERWQINSAIHYNKWDNFGKEDFEPVSKSFKELLAAFACPKCNDCLYVSPDRETAEELRCSCGSIHFNLKNKDS